MIKEMIVSGKFEELCREVFNQKLNDDSEGTFTTPLVEEDECALVKQVLLGVPMSKDFLFEYLKHYPLGNKAVDLLISHLDNQDSKHAVLKIIERYGYTEGQGLAICHRIGSNDVPFMRKFCHSGRVFYIDLYQTLSLLGADEEFGEIYRKSVDEYRSTRS